MIRVHEQPEPDNFDATVRQPGLAHLASKNVAPKDVVPKRHNWSATWKKCKPELRARYGGICAYFAVYVEERSGAPEVDHFLPNACSAARLAYEWSNYRYACHALNNTKKQQVLPIDPFEVEDHWFFLNALKGSLYANPTLEADLKIRIGEMVRMLRLSEGPSNRERLKVMKDYRDGDISRVKLEREFPFIYRELLRQGLL